MEVSEKAWVIRMKTAGTLRCTHTTGKPQRERCPTLLLHAYTADFKMNSRGSNFAAAGASGHHIYSCSLCCMLIRLQ